MPTPTATKSIFCAGCQAETSHTCSPDKNGNPIVIEAEPEIPVMPQRKGPERDAWLASAEGIAYKEKQAAAKRGRPHRIEIVEQSYLNVGPREVKDGETGRGRLQITFEEI